MLNAHGGWLLSSTEHAARAWRPVHVPSHRHEPPGREAGRLHLLDLLGRCVEASRCGITMAHSLVGVCVCVCVCVGVWVGVCVGAFVNVCCSGRFGARPPGGPFLGIRQRRWKSLLR